MNIKLCGLSRLCDIETANRLMPDYIGFVLAPASRRYVTPEQAAHLKKALHRDIAAVGVFVDEEPEFVVDLLDRGIIDAAQLHGHEDPSYIFRLKSMTSKTIFKAFRVDSRDDVRKAEESPADMILLDSGQGGTGTCFNWELIKDMKRPYFLAGGLDVSNVRSAFEQLHPYGVDISSGIETGGQKDPEKMIAFVTTIRQMKERN